MRGGYSPARGLQNTTPQWVVAPEKKIDTAHAECTQVEDERRQFYKHDFDEGILDARRNLQRPITPGRFKNKDLEPYPNPA
jgi:hypothetical protein